jgi:hypothetical protein
MLFGRKKDAAAELAETSRDEERRGALERLARLAADDAERADARSSSRSAPRPPLVARLADPQAADPQVRAERNAEITDAIEQLRRTARGD